MNHFLEKYSMHDDNKDDPIFFYKMMSIYIIQAIIRDA